MLSRFAKKALPAGALLLGLTAGAACRRGPDETRFINFDAESSPGAAASGWSGPERSPDGDTFTWCQARQARIAVFSHADGDRLVRFKCWPFRFPGSPPQAVSVFVNDAKLESAQLADGPKIYTFTAPKAVWKDGPNELRLEFAYAEAPKDRIPGNPDTRTLSAAFDWLEIVPPAPQAGKKG